MRRHLQQHFTTSAASNKHSRNEMAAAADSVFNCLIAFYYTVFKSNLQPTVRQILNLYHAEPDYTGADL